MTVMTPMAYFRVVLGRILFGIFAIGIGFIHSAAE